MTSERSPVSADRLADLFGVWDAAMDGGPDSEYVRALIVWELTLYYPERAGFAQIGALLGLDMECVADYLQIAGARTRCRASEPVSLPRWPSPALVPAGPVSEPVDGSATVPGSLPQLIRRTMPGLLRDQSAIDYLV